MRSKIALAVILISLQLSADELKIYTTPPKSEVVADKLKDYDFDNMKEEDYAPYWYGRALILVEMQNLDEAKTDLAKASALDPNLKEAYLQYGYICLWQNDISCAYENFTKSDISEKECNKRAAPGLETIAHVWEKDPATQEQALAIYDKLIECIPNGSDYFYYEGRLLHEMKDDYRAEKFLTKSLEISPKNKDPAEILVNIYSKQKRWDEARELIVRYPESQETNLEKITQEEKDNPNTAHYSYALIIENPSKHPGNTQEVKQILVDYDFDHMNEEQFASYWYDRALILLELGNLDEARADLDKAIEIDSTLKEAHVQYGYICLWQNDLECAFNSFKASQTNDGECDKRSSTGLEQIAHVWEKDDKTRQKAIEVYELLNKCVQSADYLYYEATLLHHMKEDDKAVELLKQGLALTPDYQEDADLLIEIYMKEKRLEEAKEFLKNNPSTLQSNRLLSKIAYEEKDYPSAEYYLNEVLKEDPTDVGSRYNLARIYVDQMRYNEARYHYYYLIGHDPNNQGYLEENWGLRPFTDPALYADGAYVVSVENDPSLHKAVVKTYYANADLIIQVPICDRWRVDVKNLLYHQTEHALLGAQGVNYDVYEEGGQITSHHYISKNWKLDGTARFINAWGNGKMIYPFGYTCNFEPASYLTYKQDKTVLWGGFAYESFIIKNFSVIESQLLRTASIESHWEHNFGGKLSPELRLWGIRTFIHDNLNNRRYWLAALLQTALPCSKELTASYLAEHGSFRDLSRNYYSYKNQWQQTLTINAHKDFKNHCYFNGFWAHRWRSTRDLFLPIGDTVFVASKLFILSNWVDAAIGYRYRDKMNFEVGASYYKDTLPYRAIGVRANFLYFF